MASKDKNQDFDSIMATRSKSNIWLIGQLEKNLPDNVLPTNYHILKTFFFHHTIAMKTVAESLKTTAEELVYIWEKARIPTAFLSNIVSKMKLLIEEYNLLKKNKARVSEAQKSREKKFKEKMELLFDIAHKRAESFIKLQEDKVFLADQRKDRQMKMAGIDKKLTLQESRTQERKKRECNRKKREEERKQTENSSFVSSFEDEEEDKRTVCSTETDNKDYISYETEIPTYYKKQLKKESSPPDKSCILQNMLSSRDVSSTLDRINLSDSKFTILAAAIAKADGQDLDTASLSRSTVYRKRSAHRAGIDASISHDFQEMSKPPLIVHWDGKIMCNTTCKNDPKSMIDRLSVVVTGLEIDKVLGIIKITSGTGLAQAKAVIQLLRLWNVFEDVIGMSFDTTASNTGCVQGACVILEKELGRNLLYFACRHHIHELIAGGVFSVLFGPSKGPNIPLFQRFQQSWPYLNQQNYKILDNLQLNTPYLQQLKGDVTSFLQDILAKEDSYMPREDYREMVDLCLLVLGCLPKEKIYHFKIPGAYHSARWMGKVIYCMKIFLFRDEFKLTTKEQRNLTEFCMFACLIYVKAWISCPKAADAPINDLRLFQQLKKYTEVNAVVAMAAIQKLESHLWYLGQNLFLFPCFQNCFQWKTSRS